MEGNRVMIAPQTQIILGGLASAFAQAFESAAYKVIGEIREGLGALGEKNEADYWYAFQGANLRGFVDLPNNTTIVPGIFRVNENSDFIATRITAVAFDAGTGAVNVNPSFTIAFENTGSDKNLQNFPIHVRNLAGNSAEAIPLPKTMLFPRSQSIEATFSNLTTTATRIQVVVHGYKRYDLAEVNKVLQR